MPATASSGISIDKDAMTAIAKNYLKRSNNRLATGNGSNNNDGNGEKIATAVMAKVTIAMAMITASNKSSGIGNTVVKG